MARVTAPALTALQRRAAERSYPHLGRTRHNIATNKNIVHGPVPAHCVVTGGSGFVGQRLVEMLVERGAQRVVSFDILPQPPSAWQDSRIVYMQGDLRRRADVDRAVAGADCVWHVGAAVGPFHPSELYEDVNVGGCRHVVEACLAAGVGKLVMSSSPSTRFDGSDIDGLTELELPKLPQKSYLQEYAETKAKGELVITQACCEKLLTVAIAPHQVYGPRDTLWTPNIMETAATGKLRVFGNGRNRACFTYVDNYCHGLILGERALKEGSPALGGFYICTDADTHPHSEGYAYLWEEVDRFAVGLGLPSVLEKFHLPQFLMYFLAYICNVVGFCLGRKLKLSPFSVKMLVMHRWFRPELAKKDLGYEPIIPFREGWNDSIDWFKREWLPKYLDRQVASSYGVIHRGSQAKIDGQSKKIE
ncbi:3BETAHSD/D1 [Symbiodinium sp. CCMP2592]|nr:3BETAHSD/D1 [Symbiodinium sp. CCMP2592]